MSTSSFPSDSGLSESLSLMMSSPRTSRLPPDPPEGLPEERLGVAAFFAFSHHPWRAPRPPRAWASCLWGGAGLALEPLDHDRWTAAAAAAGGCARVSPRFTGMRFGSRTTKRRSACVKEREGRSAGACVRAQLCDSTGLGALPRRGGAGKTHARTGREFWHPASSMRRSKRTRGLFFYPFEASTRVNTRRARAAG